MTDLLSMRKMCCGQCGIEFGVPSHFYEEQRRLGASGGWHCPNGHPRVFKESTADVLRRERDNLKQQLAAKDDDIRWHKERREAAERQAAAARGQVTKIKNRVSHGVCPCCNRTFQNLSRHMAGKHPTYRAEMVQ